MTKNKVLNYIRENRMIEEGQGIVVGVSGGADSMCLLDILLDVASELGISLAVVHIHHGIRKETADRDAAFVESFCASKGVPCYIRRYDVPTLASQWGMSHEEAGRRVRYEAFEEALSRFNGSGRIAVAHNADDNVETVLLNLFRGSGIKGMTGIQPVRDNIIRPILCLSRSEIEEYNASHNIEYVQDETNLVDEYTRNKIRLNILPEVHKINNKAHKHINMAAESLAIIDDYMESQGRRLYDKLVDVDDVLGKVYIRTEDFVELHMAMKIQLVKMCLYAVAGRSKDITKHHMDSVLDLFQLPVGRTINLPYDMVAKKEYEGVSVRKVEARESVQIDYSEIHIVDEGTYEIELAGQSMTLTVSRDVYTEEIFRENQYTKWIDCDIMKCNLSVRTRRNGDYIIVDDKGSRKKLKDFFIDKKIPKEDRDRVVLVANGNEIVWIVGHRLNSSYKITEASKNIWKLEINNL